MPNVMATLPNIGGALFPVLQSLADATAGVPAVTFPIQQSAKFGCKVNFAAGKIPLGGKNPPPKCI